MTTQQPLIDIIMGSDSDWPIMQAAATICQNFQLPFAKLVVSAHRTPEYMLQYAKAAHTKGIRVIIAGAGGAAHLPGMVASLTPLPVIGVPINNQSVHGLDALLSIVQMPAGVPVATVAINNSLNAGLLAIKIIAQDNPALQTKIMQYKTTLAEESYAKNNNLANTDIDEALITLAKTVNKIT